MQAADILKYGNGTLMRALSGLTPEECGQRGVCGYWSVKDIVAHLASYELVLIDVLSGFTSASNRETPMLEAFTRRDLDFNDDQVGRRQGMDFSATLAEYQEAHNQVMQMIVQVPEAARNRTGSLPWYGEEYALDDFLVYSYYGHKREHSAQIHVFRDRIGK